MIAFVHRGLTAASLAGLLGRSLAGVRVRAGALGTLDGEADLFVATDDGSTAVPRVAAPLALVFSSPVAAALVRETTVTAPDAIEAYRLAREWAEARKGSDVAPPVTPERLVAITEAAAAAGLVLVEPELPLALAPLRTAFPRPVDRAVLASIALGALARPALFVPAARAPKTLRVRPELVGWIRGTAPAPAGEEALVAAALDILRERGRPVPWKELLREARERAASTSRGTPSTGDAAKLATALERLSHHGTVELFAVDPDAPGWDLRTSSAGA